MYVYSKFRNSFGRQSLFQNVPAHLVDSIKPDKREQNLYTLRNPVNRVVQVSQPLSQHEINTTKVEIQDRGINHEEGGWPKDIHLYNEEHVERYRRRIKHDESYVHAVVNLAPTFEHYIDQNNAIEMYETYFANMSSQPPIEKYNFRISNIFRDSHERPISSVVWTNENNSKLAASYCNKTYNQLHSNESKDLNICYVWDIQIQTSPQHKFYPAHPCWQLACSPTDADIFVTGLQNGTVEIFDIRNSNNAVSNSSVYNSHRAPITSLLYIHSRTNTEFFTGSLDGECLWWDTRNLNQPLDKISVTLHAPTGEEDNLAHAEAITSLQYDRTLPTRFLCGTVTGKVINVNRMGKTHSEILHSYWETQTGPVRKVQRSPCTTRMFLTCGDWTIKVWSEEVHTAPIIVTKPFRNDVTDAAWAPLRYSCYMVACSDGVFYYWDLLRKYREPVATLQVSKHELNKISPHNMGKLVAIGDNVGAIHLLELPENMILPGSNDKALMHHVYERETKREHILDSRVKEIKLKLKTKEEEAAVDASSLEELDEEDVLKTVEEDYFNVVKKELNAMDESLLFNIM